MSQVLKPCDQEIFDKGRSVWVGDIPKHTAEEICFAVSAVTGWKFDWHYIGGRVHVKALAPVPPTGGEVEVLAVVDETDGVFPETLVTHRDAIDAALVGTELIDRAHFTRLQAENAALQQRLNTADQRVDELQRKAKLYDQLQRGAELLPQGWMITVEVERDGGGVTLIDPQGNDLDYPSNRESMGDEVEDAIEEALAQQVAL